MTIKDNNSHYLLVYGTLLNAGNAYADLLHKNSRPAGDGWFPGCLYDIGDYPGAIYDQAASSKVYGQIRQITDVNKVLPILDEYEGFGADEEQPNLFVRELVEVFTGAGANLVCWVYLFNRPIKEYRVIEDGRYK